MLRDLGGSSKASQPIPSQIPTHELTSPAVSMHFRCPIVRGCGLECEPTLHNLRVRAETV
jgi:hypothetical protein